MTTPILTTTRLSLVPASLDDVEFVQAEFPYWEIVRFMNARVPWPYPADGALTFYRDVLLPQIARGEAHSWSLRPCDAPEIQIGVVTLHITADGENRGFWIAHPHQRRGFARETADAATDFYFRVLDQPELRVSKAVVNAASRRISVAQGMRVIWAGERDYVSGRLASETWAITRDEWTARRAS
ncbi:GNAT family N-acetyltransferase [Acidiphilium sp. AL]|uniref:GNAT family N-acetyltransferase n=1 Tax=Acidiphilium sp. AL TaxID=2871704 RepID=UPI0021CB7CC2|nr:GNAT family N-acetyltransferase [Acidiphilium sp. AL]MCU4158492.1 GNAT family N-acetyltransferase [Acidiphilium sp. AL]